MILKIIRSPHDIPSDYKLNYILSIGYANEQPNAKPRDASKVKYIKWIFYNYPPIYHHSSEISVFMQTGGVVVDRW